MNSTDILDISERIGVENDQDCQFPYFNRTLFPFPPEHLRRIDSSYL